MAEFSKIKQLVRGGPGAWQMEAAEPRGIANFDTSGRASSFFRWPDRPASAIDRPGAGDAI